jgi:EmrB/QacA subfamily drug resistance transporter
MTGVAVFTVASLVCGLAESQTALIAARAVQGVGAALISPTGLSIVTTTFAEGPERNKALGIWGAVGGGGAAAGVLLGGVLTESLGWEWVFFVNVPVGLAALALAPGLLERDVRRAEGRLDVAGAALITAALVVLVFGLVEAPDAGWSSARTLALLAGAIALLAAFVLVESRASTPIVPLSTFRRRTTSAANAIAVLQGAIVFATFLLLSLYMQQVLDYSALEAGLAYLTTALVAIASAAGAQATISRAGVKPVLLVGLGAFVVAQVWFTALSPDGGYATDLLLGMVAMGVGVGASFVAVSVAAVAGSTDADAGLASGLVTTAQQIGGALGVAVLTAVAVARTQDDLAAGSPMPTALTEGFAVAFLVAAAIALISLLLAALLLDADDLREVEVP